MGDAELFDMAKHGLWAAVKTKDGRIDHTAWMRARSTNGFVGTCRRCGAYLSPFAPVETRDGRTDYEAGCINPQYAVRLVPLDDGSTQRKAIPCGWSALAPGGRLQRNGGR